MESKFYVQAWCKDGTVFDNGLSYESREQCLEAIAKAGLNPFRIDIKEVLFQY